jgi:hypothetical protein
MIFSESHTTGFMPVVIDFQPTRVASPLRRAAKRRDEFE